MSKTIIFWRREGALFLVNLTGHLFFSRQQPHHIACEFYLNLGWHEHPVMTNDWDSAELPRFVQGDEMRVQGSDRLRQHALSPTRPPESVLCSLFVSV